MSKFIDNIRQELTKNKDMKDNISKFREEAKKLEESEALKQARRKFDIVESEASKGGEVFKEQIDAVKEKLQQQLKDAGQSDLAKKASKSRKRLNESYSFYLGIWSNYYDATSRSNGGQYWETSTKCGKFNG